MIADEAMARPYRQIQPMPTKKFCDWLRRREVRFTSWETLHFLWLSGLVHPVMVREAALLTPGLQADGRFQPVDVGTGEPAYADLGVTVKDISNMPMQKFPIELNLHDSLYWHPFLLPQFIRLSDILNPHIALDMALRGPEAYGKCAKQGVALVPNMLVQFANDGRQLSFLRLVALLLAAEPLMHPIIHGHITGSLADAASFEGYFAWAENIDPPGMLAEAGLTLEQAKTWHRDLAIEADLIDPLQHFRVLLQHANRRDRRHLRGDALAAHDLYDQAETLRRYLERFHECELFEEDDYQSGPRRQYAKKRKYGTHRAGDVTREGLWRIVRSFGLDPQIKATWFLEGDTEIAFFRRVAEAHGVDLDGAGLILYNLGGNRGLNDKNVALRHLLKQCRENGTFTLAAIDHDQQGGTSHLDDVQRMANQGLLTAGYKIWDPDFEEANFSLEELAAAATQFAQRYNPDISITAADIASRMQEKDAPAGKAIEGILSSQRIFDGKGQQWGQCLADVALTNPGNRPVFDVFRMLVRAQLADFDGTVEHFTIDNTGGLIENRSASET